VLQSSRTTCVTGKEREEGGERGGGGGRATAVELRVPGSGACCWPSLLAFSRETSPDAVGDAWDSGWKEEGKGRVDEGCGGSVAGGPSVPGRLACCWPSWLVFVLEASPGVISDAWDSGGDGEGGRRGGKG
jgi:hypothetical protein